MVGRGDALDDDGRAVASGIGVPAGGLAAAVALLAPTVAAVHGLVAASLEGGVRHRLEIVGRAGLGRLRVVGRHGHVGGRRRGGVGRHHAGHVVDRDHRHAVDDLRGRRAGEGESEEEGVHHVGKERMWRGAIIARCKRRFGRKRKVGSGLRSRGDETG